MKITLLSRFHVSLVSSTLIKPNFSKIRDTGLKSILFVIAILNAPNLLAQHSLEKLWVTDTTLRRPESVLFDASSKTLYVSNIGDIEKEGDGSISKISPDGKIINQNWVTGLTAPKGLGLFKNLLYAAEQTTVAVIDVSKASVVQHIPVEGAQMLNDISIDPKGIVYVSDTRKNRVYRIENGKASVYLENMNSANGLLATGTTLYILTGTSVQKADENKNLTTLTDGIEGGADGIEMINHHEFIVTGWAGVIYFVKDNGTKQVLLDTRDKKINSADLGYDPISRTVYIPEMTSNCVAAYKLN
jgi:sugar lactone lactonase YvrE